MYLRSDERGPGMNNRLALRLALFGGLALVLFAVLFFRLWQLQVLSGEEYLAEAKNNRTREFRVSAPRGEILDRNGEVLVDNRTSLALQVNPQKLPADAAERRAELARLGELTHMPLRQVRRTIAEGQKVAPGAPVTLRRDVGDDLVYYLQENQARFPGVDGAAGLRPPLPGGDPRRAHARQRRRGQRGAAEGAALQGPRAGGRDWPGRGRVQLRPLPARASRA